MIPLNPKRLLYARDLFRGLLSQRNTDERTWQSFFADHPYVLSLSLPLRLDPQDIVPLGRPGKTEPDLIFYPTKDTPPPFFGVIELKRPDSPIVTMGRKNVALLSRDAETAVQEASEYLKHARKYISRPDEIIFLGNGTYIFVIMGMSKELGNKLGQRLYFEMVQRRLPANLQILPYDTLLRQFEARLTPQVYFLVPISLPHDHGDFEDNWLFTLNKMPECFYLHDEVRTEELRQA